MDMPSLVAVNLVREHRPTPMSASDEDEYYRDPILLPRGSICVLGSIAASVCVILLLAGAAEA